jgi:hypothetical protein
MVGYVIMVKNACRLQIPVDMLVFLLCDVRTVMFLL